MVERAAAHPETLIFVFGIVLLLIIVTAVFVMDVVLRGTGWDDPSVAGSKDDDDQAAQRAALMRAHAEMIARCRREEAVLRPTFTRERALVDGQPVDPRR